MTTTINGVKTLQIRNAKNGDFDLNLGGSGGGNVYPQLTIKSRSQGNVEFEFVDGQIPITSFLNDKHFIEQHQIGNYSTLYVKDIKVMLNDLLYDADTESYVESGFYSCPLLIQVEDWGGGVLVPICNLIGKQYIYRMFFDENLSLNEIKYYTGSFSIRMKKAVSVTSRNFSILSPAEANGSNTSSTKVYASLMRYDGNTVPVEDYMLVCNPDIKVSSNTNFTFFAGGQLIYYNPSTSSASLTNNQTMAYIEHSANGES